MIRGYIDSASIHGVMAALTYQKVDQWPPWTLRSATEVTCALINDYWLEVAPGPGTYAGAHGLYDHTMCALALAVSHSRPTKSWLIRAQNRVKRWASRYPLSIKGAYKKVHEDRSFADWLDWSIANAWVEHSATLQGLFDQEFIPQLASALNCSENELRQVWERSCDLKQVEQWSRKRPDTDDFKLATDAFVISALLRGRYHDHVAEAANVQIMHHPMRDAVLPKKKEGMAFIPTNTEAYFTSIILSSALAERKIEDRISLWADNLIKARKAMRVGTIDMRQKDSNSVAENLAVNAAKQLDLRLYSHLRATEFDVLSALVIDNLFFVICGWAAIPVGPGIDAAIKYKTGKSLGDTLASRFYQKRGRLRDLAEAVPGRIKGRWGE